MALERLYLVRHGQAEVNHPRGDAFRELSAGGRDRILGLLEPLAEKVVQAELGLSSPYRRAWQTAELFAPAFAWQRLEASPVLTPEVDPEETWLELIAWEAQGVRSVVLFSHNPLVTDLAHRCLVPGSLAAVSFHTPTLLALRFAHGLKPHQGQPLWILHP